MKVTGKAVRPLDHNQMCPKFQSAVELISKKWNGFIIHALMDGPMRFNELLTKVPLTPKLLSDRFRELEAEGIVKRHVFNEVPVRIEYELTAKGYALKSVFESISDWAAEWNAKEIPAEIN
jgi:DNA-binding HxlR family transcriptional regulator